MSGYNQPVYGYGGYNQQEPSSGYSQQQPPSNYSQQQAASGYGQPLPGSSYGNPLQGSGYGYPPHGSSYGYDQQQTASEYGQQKPTSDYSQQAASGYSQPQPVSRYGQHQSSSSYGQHELNPGYGQQEPGSEYASYSQPQHSNYPAHQQQPSYGQQQESSGYGKQKHNSYKQTSQHHPYKKSEQPHPYQPQQQLQQQQQSRGPKQSQHIVFDDSPTGHNSQQPCCQWVFTLALKVPEDSYAKLFGGSHAPERYIPPSRDARWSREATKAMESAPLHPRAVGEAFKVVCDRQQRAIVIASHDKLPDSQMSLSGFQEMLMTLCDTLSNTITGKDAAVGYSSYGPPQQQQQGANSVCIRYNKGTWLRSFKMHLKADVPVSGYLSLLQQRYHDIPPLGLAEATAMETRAKSDTKGFRHLLGNASFNPAPGHPCRGGVHLTVPKLVQAGFFCLSGEQQPPGCAGQWWGCSVDSMLVFMPPPMVGQLGQPRAGMEQRIGLCSVTQVFEEVARFTERYMVPACEGTAEGASTGRGGAGGRMPGFCVCVVPSLQCND